MAIIVEDGTGLSTAETYVSVADALVYHVAMGNTAWAAATTAAQEIALRRGTQYIDNRYRFRGEQLVSDQALEHPRVGYERGNRVEAWPVAALKRACCEVSLRALADTLYEDVSTDQVTEETVGPITIKYASKGGQTRYPVVDALLARYVLGGPGQLRLERA